MYCLSIQRNFTPILIGQLIRENNATLDKTFIYEYNNSGAGVYGLNCMIFGMKEYSHLFMLDH